MENIEEELLSKLDIPFFYNNLEYIQKWIDYYTARRDPRILFLMKLKKISCDYHWLHIELSQYFKQKGKQEIAIFILKKALENKVYDREVIQKEMEKYGEINVISEIEAHRYLYPKNFKALGKIWNSYIQVLYYKKELFKDENGYISLEEYRFRKIFDDLIKKMESKNTIEDFKDTKESKDNITECIDNFIECKNNIVESKDTKECIDDITECIDNLIECKNSIIANKHNIVESKNSFLKSKDNIIEYKCIGKFEDIAPIEFQEIRVNDECSEINQKRFKRSSDTNLGLLRFNLDVPNFMKQYISLLIDRNKQIITVFEYKRMTQMAFRWIRRYLTKFRKVRLVDLLARSNNSLYFSRILELYLLKVLLYIKDNGSEFLVEDLCVDNDFNISVEKNSEGSSMNAIANFFNIHENIISEYCLRSFEDLISNIRRLEKVFSSPKGLYLINRQKILVLEILIEFNKY